MLNQPILDAERVERAKRGDLAAFNELVEEYQHVALRVCFRILGTREAAEEAAQEAFVSAWLKIGSFRSGVFRAWLLTIAANQSRSELRRRSQRSAASLECAIENGLAEPTEPAALPEVGFGRSCDLALIEQALSQLPPALRTAVTLHDVDGLHYAEIARATQVSLGTVKSRIARGRMQMRRHLQRQDLFLTA